MKSVLKTVGLGLAALILTACAAMPSDGAPHDSVPASGAHRLGRPGAGLGNLPIGSCPGCGGRLRGRVDAGDVGEGCLRYSRPIWRSGDSGRRRQGRTSTRRVDRAATDRLDAVLNDGDAMAQILEGLTNGEDARPQPHTITWVPMMKFNGIHYLRRWYHIGKFTGADISDLTQGTSGLRSSTALPSGATGMSGPVVSQYQDGDASFLNPGTPVYAGQGLLTGVPVGHAWSRAGRRYMKPTPIRWPGSGEDLLDIQGQGCGHRHPR